MPGQAVVFPDDFLPVGEWDLGKLVKYPTVICSSEPRLFGDAIAEKCRQLKRWSDEVSREKPFPAPRGLSEFEIRKLENFSGSDLFFATQRFILFNPPLESRSKKQGSVAVYYGASPEYGLLLQFILSGGEVSIHNHERHGWIERNNLLAGKAELHTCENEHQLIFQLTETNPIGPTMGPKVIHQTTTPFGQPSFVLIEIMGDPDWYEKWLRGDGHCFKQFPKPRQLIKKKA